MKFQQFAFRRGQSAAATVIITAVAMVGVVATSSASAQRTPAVVAERLDVRPVGGATVDAAIDHAASEVARLEESVTATWDKAGDNDLFVVDPDGVEISYRHSTESGALSLDDIDPAGPETFTPTSEAHGPFQVKVRCFHLCVGSTVTVNAVVRGEPVSLGSHTMTAEKEVWAAGSVNLNPNYTESGMPTRSFNVKTVGINDTWVGIFDTSRHAWNTSGAGANIGRETSAASTFTAATYPTSWYGLYTPYGSRHTDRRFMIQINAGKLQEDISPHWKYLRWVQSVTVHELGHALSLVDNPKTTKQSIMKYDIDRTTVITPTAWDATMVKRIYS